MNDLKSKGKGLDDRKNIMKDDENGQTDKGYRNKKRGVLKLMLRKLKNSIFPMTMIVQKVKTTHSLKVMLKK